MRSCQPISSEDKVVEQPENGGQVCGELAGSYVRTFQRLYPFFVTEARARFLIDRVSLFIRSRNERSRDLFSQEARSAIEIEKRLYPMGPPKMFLCVDGRVLAKLIASAHGGAIRTPAGDSDAFLPDRTGEGVFLASGELAKDLMRWQKNSHRVACVFDSHWGCAARKEAMIDAFGSAGSDDGLREDVIRKKKMAVALIAYFRDCGLGGLVMPIQTSYDPETGYLFAGLESDSILGEDRVRQFGFTRPILDELASEGRILSTKKWSIEGGMLHSIFLANAIEIDYERHYRSATLAFWSKMLQMDGICIPLIEEEVRRIYAHLRGNADAIRQMAVLFLANAYTGFLLGRNEHEQCSRIHDEGMIVLSAGDRGPYASLHSFGVNPHHPNALGTVKFVEGLIRRNRESGRMVAIEGDIVDKCFGSDPDAYIRCPVPLAIFEVLDDGTSDDVIELLRAVDWSDLPDLDWMNMVPNAFRRYCFRKLSKSGRFSAFDEVFEKLEKLRQTAITMFSPGFPITNDLLEGRLLPIWFLRDFNREIIMMLPFLARGYSPE